MRLFIFKHGIPVEETFLHPTVARMVRRDRVTLRLNMVASESRWEAEGPGGEFALGDDPNEAVLDCCSQIRKGRA